MREVANGEDGWQAIESDPSIAMVVSDIDMPKLDGFGLLERVRGSKDARIKALPIIIISGQASKADINRALDAGASSYLLKPIHDVTLLETLRVHLPAEALMIAAAVNSGGAL